MTKEVFGMTINAWIQWTVATITASFSIMVFVYTTFLTKEDAKSIAHRIDKVEQRQDKSDEKIERKLELINQKLDTIIINRAK